jgi:signal transduction histidine kinase
MDPATAVMLKTAIHDLKGPANRLRLLSELLKRQCPDLDADAREMLDHIESSAAEVDRVAQRLKTYFESSRESA